MLKKLHKFLCYLGLHKTYPVMLVKYDGRQDIFWFCSKCGCLTKINETQW